MNWNQQTTNGRHQMRKVRINVTVEYPETKKLVPAKANEIKEEITEELGGIALDAFSSMNPTDLKVRFLRNK